MFDDVFSDGSLQKIIKDKQNDIWKNSPFEGYVYLNPRQKGNFGEMFVEKLLTIGGHTVEKRSNSGHDRIIDDIKTEIKFGLCNKGVNNCFLINHISKDKDWDRLIFCGINRTESDSIFIWFTKEDFCKLIKTNNDIFVHQQGGKKIKNDDYMCGNIEGLLRQPFVNHISKWQRKKTLIDFIL